METVLFFTLCGYLSGSILFAQVAAKLMNKREMLQKSRDQNPGTANAFQYGGFWCGLMTLCGDLLKGFLPVYLFFQYGGGLSAFPLGAALVIAAPVIGHGFPLFFQFKGGKGIAVTFGSLMGLYPAWGPVIIFVALFLFFSLVLRVTPHFHRTIITYLTALVYLFWQQTDMGVVLGFLLITMTVCLRMHMSKEERVEMKVRLLWMH